MIDRTENPMYKLAIVDDDPTICNHMSKTVDWNSIGFEVVKTFNDGSQVIDYLQNNPLDCILTDIKMIKVSGLELAKYIYENYPHIKVVLLSGYQEFNYAKESLKYNVCSYLLKPTNVDELTNTFQELYMKLERNRKPAPQKIEHLIKLSKELESYVQKLKVAVNGSNMSSIKQIMAELFDQNDDFDTLKSYMEYIMINILKDYEKSLDSEAAHRFTEEFGLKMASLRNKLSLYHYMIEWFEALLLLIADAMADNASRAIRKAQDYIRNNYSSDLSLITVAGISHLEPKYFSKMFKKVTGQNFIDFVISCRLEKAKKLLVESDKKVNEISTLVGYSSTRFFAKQFNEHYGTTPVKYRKLFRKD